MIKGIEKALATPGWMSPTELAYLAYLSSTRGCIAEVGSWRGRSARAVADNTHGILFCVDTWADNAFGSVFDGDAPDLCQRQNWLFDEFRKNMADRLEDNVFMLRMPSIQGAKQIADRGLTLDMVFIDAGHNYQDVVSDIQAWKPLLRKSGILCGHDYNAVHHPEVIAAVNDLIPKFKVVDTIWSTE